MKVVVSYLLGFGWGSKTSFDRKVFSGRLKPLFRHTDGKTTSRTHQDGTFPFPWYSDMAVFGFFGVDRNGGGGVE